MHRAANCLRSVGGALPITITSSTSAPVANVSHLTELMSRLGMTALTTSSNGVMINHESRRYGRFYRKWHQWPNDFLPFKWERPKGDYPFLMTGDAIRDIGSWNPKALIPGAEFSKELENAPEPVRRLFTLGMAKREDVVEFQKRKLFDLVKRHDFDNYSQELKIANYTIRIRNNLYFLSKVDKDDAPRKIHHNRYILKRKKFLNELYYLNRDRYNYLIKLLGITHTVPKLGVIPEKPTRKGELRRLTTEYCDKIKEERLAKYYKELKTKESTLQDEQDQIDRLLKEEEKYLGTQNPSSI